MKKLKKVLNVIVMALFAPFVLLIQSNSTANPNKRVSGWLVVLISAIIVAIIIFFYYFAGEVFKW